jgi:hypothetical protein
MRWPSADGHPPAVGGPRRRLAVEVLTGDEAVVDLCACTASPSTAALGGSRAPAVPARAPALGPRVTRACSRWSRRSGGHDEVERDVGGGSASAARRTSGSCRARWTIAGSTSGRSGTTAAGPGRGCGAAGCPGSRAGRRPRRGRAPSAHGSARRRPRAPPRGDQDHAAVAVDRPLVVDDLVEVGRDGFAVALGRRLRGVEPRDRDPARRRVLAQGAMHRRRPAEAGEDGLVLVGRGLTASMSIRGCVVCSS